MCTDTATTTRGEAFPFQHRHLDLGQVTTNSGLATTRSLRVRYKLATTRSPRVRRSLRNLPRLHHDFAMTSCYRFVTRPVTADSPFTMGAADEQNKKPHSTQVFPCGPPPWY